MRKPFLKEYRAFIRMQHRCLNPDYPDYPSWGGRGITICPQWQGTEGFEQFLRDVGPAPTPKHTIDRFPDNNRGYEPGNVRWALMKAQARNRRSNVSLTLNGVSKTMAEWAEMLGCDRRLLWKRLKLGWSHEKALTFGFSPAKMAA